MAKWLLPVLQVAVLMESVRGEAASGGGDGAARPGGDTPEQQRAHRDSVSANMFRVYEKYSKEPRSPRDGNTVRSFRAARSVLHGRDVFQFNLSSIPDSEVILFASFHFFNKRPRHQQRPWRFRRPRHSPSSFHQPPPRLLFHGLSSKAAFASPLGNITLTPFKKGSWQSRDVTAVVKGAREAAELVIMVESDLLFGVARVRPRGPQEHLSSANLPYILLRTDDRAINEPNSVAMSLQRYGPFPGGEDASASASRIRRELHLQIQTNDIPEVQFNTLKNHELWQSTFFPAKSKAVVKAARQQAQESSEGLSKPQVLSFDERTMKKARRRQWSEPRVCSRRYLRVDFADIGWSEWVLAPKSFDAYYCAGTCGFPIPKVVRPSNHATIQSIVRAVGIVPGVPEPCCVPEKMSPLSVLFLDPDRNMVLKVYPGMSVDTCACR
ncbi:growth/differentiation factor 10 [Aulostomus maculatus]